MRTGQDNYEILAHSLTDRKLSIHRYENGVVEVTLNRPDIKCLVLSGGGAKGLAYPGAVKALEDRGYLGKLDTVNGSSAGALVAVPIAFGATHKQVNGFSDNVNVVEKLNSKKERVKQVQQFFSTVGKGFAKIPGSTGAAVQLLCDLLPRLQSEAEPMRELINENIVEALHALLNKAINDNRKLSPETIECLTQIMIHNEFVTFGHRQTLSKDFPEIKQLNITATIMIEGRPQLMVFGDETPEMCVATAALISASLPVVFQKPSVQNLGFQTTGERTNAQDGGIMSNTHFKEPARQRSPITNEEQLILKFESGNGDKKKDRGTLTSVMADKFIGAPYSARHAQEAADLKRFEKYTVIIPLKTEKEDHTTLLKGTLNFNMSLEERDQLQKGLEDNINDHLNHHKTDRETHIFNDTRAAVLAFNDELFKAAASELSNDPEAKPVIEFRQQAELALTELQEALTAAKNTAPDRLELTRDMRLAIDSLDRLGDTPEKIDWLAEKLNYGDVPDLMELLQAVKRMDAEAPGPKSAVMTKAIEEMGIRDIITRIEHFIREVIYTSKMRYGQPDRNVDLFIRVENGFREAVQEFTTSEKASRLDDFRKRYNELVNLIPDNYIARNSLVSGYVSSTTVTQAKAWLIPEK
ncbi:patatin-like phospholipase family protein [Pseudomonas sp. LB3P81]